MTVHPAQQPYDGPTLRAIRESMGIPLRRIARSANMSHGHLSKVERGEHGRPITPAILAAYEKVTKVSLDQAAAALAQHREGVTGAHGRTWRPGELSDMRRLGFNAALSALAAGGQLGEPTSRLLDATGRPTIPLPPAPVDIEQLLHLERFITGLDLRYGGGLATQLAKTTLRWAVGMLEVTSLSTDTGRRLYQAVSMLAARTGWAAFDAGAHDAARSLYRLALFTAVRAGDPHLRAHIMADAAAQHSHLGYHHDAIDLTRIVAGDERIHPAVRAVLHHVQARAHAAAGQADLCHRAIDLATQAHTDTTSTPPGPAHTWLATLHHPAGHAAATGHALATLATHTGHNSHIEEADRQLTTAINTYDHTTHTRAAALATTALAAMHIATGDPTTGHKWAQQAITTLPAVNSTRLRTALLSLADTAEQHPHDPTSRELATHIRNTITSTDPQPADSSQPQPTTTKPPGHQ